MSGIDLNSIGRSVQFIHKKIDIHLNEEGDLNEDDEGDGDSESSIPLYSWSKGQKKEKNGSLG